MDEGDLTDGMHKRKAENSNKENENNDHRSIETRRRRRSDELPSKSSQTRPREEGRTRRQSESNARSPDRMYKSEGSLDHDTPQSSYKSASERITDEHIAMSPSVHQNPPQQHPSEEIIWPAWISAMTISSPPKELEDLMKRQKQRKQRQREEILNQLSSPVRFDSPSNLITLTSDDQPDIDVTGIKSAKAALIGDGWRLQDGKRAPILSARFRPASEAPNDPRSSSYVSDLQQRVSRTMLERVSL